MDGLVAFVMVYGQGLEDDGDQMQVGKGEDVE